MGTHKIWSLAGREKRGLNLPKKALLGLVTLGAAYMPAWRAAVLDPVEVLKGD
jgi:hypothetical protein